MSDNLTRYLAILGTLKQLCPTEPHGNYLRHLHTLAAMIGGIVGSRGTNLPQIASKIPSGTQRESRSIRLLRWLSNERVTHEAFFLPFAKALLGSLPPGPLVFVMDASQIGRGYLVLVLSVLYQKRALPLCWIVVQAKTGHFSQHQHTALLGQVAALVPTGREAIFLGDGEFDGCDLLGAVRALGWEFACRPARNVLLAEAGEVFGFADLSVQPRELLSIPEVAFTAAGFSGMTVVACREAAYQEPLFLVTSLDLAAEAAYWYRKRYGIEAFFSDQKSRGFHLGHCPISDPEAFGSPADRELPGLSLGRAFRSAGHEGPETQAPDSPAGTAPERWVPRRGNGRGSDVLYANGTTPPGHGIRASLEAFADG